jgi:hypothetical protein
MTVARPIGMAPKRLAARTKLTEPSTTLTAIDAPRGAATSFVATK